MNNQAIFDSVIAGIAASNGAWLESTNPANYLAERNAAVVIAITVDAAIPTILTGVTTSQRQLIESITKGVMVGRTVRSLLSADYQLLANSIAVAFIEYNTALTDFSGDTNYPVVTNATGAVQGDVIRKTTVAGVYEPAIADTNAHASAIIGVYRNGRCIPLSECPSVNFAIAPLIGQPCYVSAVTAGKLTNTKPTIAVPIGFIVIADTTVGGVFSAQIGASGSIESQLSIDQQFIADAASVIGVLSSTLHAEFLDFNTLPITGFPPIGVIGSPVAPNPTHFGLTPSSSTITWVGNDGGSGYGEWRVELAKPVDPIALNILKNTSLTNQPWSFRIKFRQAVLINTLKFWLDKGAGNESIGFGLVNDGGWKFFAMYGNFYPMAVDPLPAQRVFLEAENTNSHILTMTSVNDGTVIFKYDNQPSIVLPLPASISPTIPRFASVATTLEIDYWGICAP